MGSRQPSHAQGGNGKGPSEPRATSVRRPTGPVRARYWADDDPTVASPSFDTGRGPARRPRADEPVSVAAAIALGAIIGFALGILVTVTTDVPLAPEIGAVLGALIGWLARRETV